jgi:hypothetical protein
MELQKVKSANIAAVGFEKQVLRILFLEGSAYDYFNVPASLYRLLMESESKGSFFQQYVVGKFKYAKVNPNLREEGQHHGTEQSTTRSSRASQESRSST